MQRKHVHLLFEILKINFVYSAMINFRHFGLVGLFKMPIVIQYGSRIRCKTRNGIAFLKPMHLNMLTIKKGNQIIVERGGTLLFTGDKACFNKENLVIVYSKGTFKIGNNFWANAFSEFYCSKELIFGDDVLIGFHVIFLDSDYHPIFNDQHKIINHDRRIILGNNVWISTNVTVLKGTHIGNKIIVGAGSLVTGKLLEEHSIYCGNPAKPVKSGVSWRISHPDFWQHEQ